MSYAAKHGIKKAIARSFVEIGKLLDDGVIPSERPPVLPSYTSSVYIFGHFVETVRKMANPRILEIGSRAVSEDSLHDMLGLTSPHEYLGFDIHQGQNVDVVGDAHELSTVLPKEHFDVVMSKSVFEHIAMPWKVILEINKILKPDGLLFINTLHTFPLHEKPWDFWRYSDEAWKVLLNRATGFEIIHAGLEFPCRIVVNYSSNMLTLQEDQEAYINSDVLARKTSSYNENILKWDIKISDILESSYPKR